MSTQIRTPQRLRKPHPFVIATRQAAGTEVPRSDGRVTVVGSGIVHLVVSPGLVRRCLLILQALFVAAECRKHTIQPTEGSKTGPPGVALVVDGHVFPIEITELRSPVAVTEEDVAVWRKANHWHLVLGGERTPPTTKPMANGRLQLTLPRPSADGRRSNWTDGPRGTVETKLASVLRELERRAEADTREAEEGARYREEYQRAEAGRLAREELARAERARADRLEREIAAWRFAHDARDYAAALRQRLLPQTDDTERERLNAYCTWIENWAERTDPTSPIQPHPSE